MDMKAIATKFVNWEIEPLENLQGRKVYTLRQKLNNKEKLSREEKNWITKQVNFNSYFRSAIPLLDWRFDFSDVLKTFVVRQYGSWTEYQATDKTALRNTLHGRIEQIVEINK